MKEKEKEENGKEEIEIYFENLERIKDLLKDLPEEEGEKRFLEIIQRDFNLGLRLAAELDHLHLAKSMIEKGANKFDGALWYACKNSNKAMVDLIIQRSDKELNIEIGLYSASFFFFLVFFFLIKIKIDKAQSGNTMMMDYLKTKKEPNPYAQIYYAEDMNTFQKISEGENKLLEKNFIGRICEEGKNIELLKNFVPLPEHMQYLLPLACESGTVEFVEYLSCHTYAGTSRWDSCLDSANQSHNLEMMKHIVCKKEVNLSVLNRHQIATYGDKELIKMVSEKTNYNIFELHFDVIVERNDLDLILYSIEQFNVSSNLKQILASFVSKQKSPVVMDNIFFHSFDQFILNELQNLALFTKNKHFFDFIFPFANEHPSFKAQLSASEDLDFFKLFDYLLFLFCLLICLDFSP